MRILVAEDDRRIAEALAAALQAAGFVAEVESDGEEAWYRGDTEEFDAIILDLGLPTLDGLGADGDGAHALHEHVLIPSLPDRAALAAGLVARLTAG